VPTTVLSRVESNPAVLKGMTIKLLTFLLAYDTDELPVDELPVIQALLAN
jgi:hypothetical protein